MLRTQAHLRGHRNTATSVRVRGQDLRREVATWNQFVAYLKAYIVTAPAFAAQAGFREAFISAYRLNGATAYDKAAAEVPGFRPPRFYRSEDHHPSTTTAATAVRQLTVWCPSRLESNPADITVGANGAAYINPADHDSSTLRFGGLRSRMSSLNHERASNFTGHLLSLCDQPHANPGFDR